VAGIFTLREETLAQLFDSPETWPALPLGATWTGAPALLLALLTTRIELTGVTPDGDDCTLECMVPLNTPAHVVRTALLAIWRAVAAALSGAGGAALDITAAAGPLLRRLGAHLSRAACRAASARPTR